MAISTGLGLVIASTIAAAAAGTTSSIAHQDAKKAANLQRDMSQAQGRITEDTGSLQGVDSIEKQATQRRLARLSKYFTSPTGILGSGASTGSTGVFG